MALITKCDRCGEIYDPWETYNHINPYENWWRYGLVKDCHPYSETRIDLCPNCKKDLERWFKNDK